MSQYKISKNQHTVRETVKPGGLCPAFFRNWISNQFPRTGGRSRGSKQNDVTPK